MPSHTKSERKKRNNSISRTKAKKILRDGEIRGRKLTKAQRGFFGAAAGR